MLGKSHSPLFWKAIRLLLLAGAVIIGTTGGATHTMTSGLLTPYWPMIATGLLVGNCVAVVLATFLFAHLNPHDRRSWALGLWRAEPLTQPIGFFSFFAFLGLIGGLLANLSFAIFSGAVDPVLISALAAPVGLLAGCWVMARWRGSRLTRRSNALPTS